MLVLAESFGVGGIDGAILASRDCFVCALLEKEADRFSLVAGRRRSAAPRECIPVVELMEK